MGTAVSLEPGVYEVTEMAPVTPPGLIAQPPVFSEDCNGVIQAGEELFCTITNEFAVYVFLTKWGSFGSEDGQFNFPAGVAVELSTGNVFVVDADNQRIQVFDSSGTFITKWGSSGTGDGQFDAPFGVAVNPSTGNVFVTDAANHRIQVFALT